MEDSTDMDDSLRTIHGYGYDEAGNKVDHNGKVIPRNRYDSLELFRESGRWKDVDDAADIVLFVECTDGYHISCYDDGTWEIWHDTSSVGSELVSISKGQDVLPDCMMNTEKESS